MGEKPAIIRTTISVPANLKARMDAVEESVNWSALACRAFENKLAEIAERKAQMNMNEILERLRATKRTEQDLDFSTGFVKGNNWAGKSATVSQLQRLKRFLLDIKTKPEEEQENWFSINNQPWIKVVEIIQDIKFHLPMTAKEFWKNNVGDSLIQANSGNYLRGFVEGAVDLWLTLEKKV